MLLDHEVEQASQVAAIVLAAPGDASLLGPCPTQVALRDGMTQCATALTVEQHGDGVEVEHDPSLGSVGSWSALA